MSVETSSSLPQFDTTHYCSQIFWLFLCFVVLVLFLKTVIIPRVDKSLGKRMAYIDTMDNENNSVAASNEAIESEIKNVKNAVNADITNIIFEANDDAAKTINTKTQMIDNATSENFKVYRRKLGDEVHNVEYFAKNEIVDLVCIIADKIRSCR